ncbi:MAG: T9SS type A sorting domain-containing protein [Bacteroidia bacterium]
MRMHLLGLFGLSAWAQIQITSSDLPSAGQSFTVSQSRPQPNWDFLSTGPNYTWNFDQLPADTQLVVRWQAPWEVPQYIFSCGNASLQALLFKIADSIRTPLFTIRNLYAFLRKSNTKMSIQGIGASLNGIPLTQCYQDEDEIYMLPLSYGRTDSTTFWLRIDLSTPNGNFTLAQRGYRLHHVDGYGQLTTPYGSFTVLRLRRDVHQKDTLYWNGNPIFRTDTSYIELEWLGQGQSIPLLRVQGNLRQIGNNLTLIPAVIQFKDESSSTALSFPSERFILSPNPSHGILRIPTPGASYQICDLTGKVILSDEVPQDGILSLPPTLPDGIYFIKVAYDAQESWYRFSLIWN